MQTKNERKSGIFGRVQKWKETSNADLQKPIDISEILTDDDLAQFDSKAIPIFRNLITSLSTMQVIHSRLDSDSDKALLGDVIVGGYYLLGTIIDGSFGDSVIPMERILLDTKQFLNDVSPIVSDAHNF